MRLTEELVARVPPHRGESGRLAGRNDLPHGCRAHRGGAEPADGGAALRRGLDLRLRLADLEPRIRLCRGTAGHHSWMAEVVLYRLDQALPRHAGTGPGSCCCAGRRAASVAELIAHVAAEVQHHAEHVG